MNQSSSTVFNMVNLKTGTNEKRKQEEKVFYNLKLTPPPEITEKDKEKNKKEKKKKKEEREKKKCNNIFH